VEPGVPWPRRAVRRRAGRDAVPDPAGILRDAEATGLLDFARPVCLLLVAILHFVPDADDPAALVAAFRDALAPGSYLIPSHATMDGYPAEPPRARFDPFLGAVGVRS
jgi:hypothetical protein